MSERLTLQEYLILHGPIDEHGERAAALYSGIVRALTGGAVEEDDARRTVTEEPRPLGYRRIHLSFAELALLLRGNSRPILSDFPQDLTIHHVIEESRLTNSVALIVSSREWEPTPEGEFYPDVFSCFIMRTEAGPPRETWIEKVEVLNWEPAKAPATREGA